MRMKSIPTPIVALAFLAACLAPGLPGHAGEAGASGTKAVHDGSSIGVVDFGVACDENVQADFDHALGLMHHMMYAEARRAFEEIAETDPGCAMAHWGIATTRFQPLWPTRPGAADRQRGRVEIAKARELAETERERLLIEATAAFFEEPEPAGFWERLDRWSEGMDAAYEAFPDDPDIASIYALSRITLAQTAEDRAPLHDEAEKILRAAFERHPDHPGAIHYMIHATDADGRANNALDIVEAYAPIAPEVPHALHMPSHIYVRLGDWPEVIEWNRRSADSALDYPVNGTVSHHYIHAMDYLLYAYLQQGEDDRALAVLEETASQGDHQASFISAFHAAAMPARYAVERRQWDEAVHLEPRTPDHLPWDQALWAEGLSWYARGLGGVHTGDMELAREAEEKLKELRDSAEDAGERRFATYIEVDRKILSGWIAHHGGDYTEAIELMRAAAELESTVEKHPVTPGALLPPNEALGDLLMELDRPGEALEAYQDSDGIWPGRYRTLLGAARAASVSGDIETAEGFYGQLLEIAEGSQLEVCPCCTPAVGQFAENPEDFKRPGLAEARNYVGR